ncbi:MAG: NlpC/P60 family protein [Oscillospiraceae bacterium]|nr:NlpC/P60 family protein [Oscillospiraceae bacterium]
MAKAAKGLVDYCKAQLGKPYWYGSFGQFANTSDLDWYAKTYPVYWSDSRVTLAREKHIGQKVHDCVGLIKGYLWSADANSPAKYREDQDVSANGMRTKCTEKGDISTIPEIPGTLVFMSGHVGVYIGNGEVIEARGFQYGVVKTQLANRPWKWWGKCPWIDYSVSSAANSSQLKAGDRVAILPGAKYTNGKSIPERFIGKTMNVMSVSKDGANALILQLFSRIALQYLKKI